jgi:HK97 family phage portal protein
MPELNWPRILTNPRPAGRAPADWARVERSKLHDRAVVERLGVWEKSAKAAGRFVTFARDGDHGLFEAWPLHERAIDSFTEYPGLQEQLAAAFGVTSRPWRVPSTGDALGVPAILRAVTLIANTTGSLSLNAYRNGRRLSENDRPRLIVRPDPFQTPRDFYSSTAYSMARWGEAWWWVAKRDGDDSVLSVIAVPPREVTVEDNPRDPLRPIITWRGQRMRNEDMRQIFLLREPGELRGKGPLQICGAATSVAVEAQEWAANFYASGGYPNLWIKAATDLSGDPDESDEYGRSEAERLKAQWTASPPNTPKVTDSSIESIEQFDPNPQGAQMLDARDHNNGDAARMFGLPGSLLEYQTGGSSLTYQNLEQEMTKFLRTCLIPNYLEPIEQEMSDLLTRSTIARFHVDSVNRADIKTRYEVYGLGIDSGVLTPETAQQMEGIVPGDVDNAAIPFAPPAAFPSVVPIQQRSLSDLRCSSCGRLAGKVAGAAEIKCSRCGQMVVAA